MTDAHTPHKLGDFQSRQWGRVLVYKGRYASNNALAILLRTESGNSLTTLSVNMDHDQIGKHSHELPPGHFYAKEWGGNEDIIADCLASGLFELVPELPVIVSGFVQARVWRLKKVE